MSEGTKLEEKIRFERMDGSSPPLRFKLSAINHSATSPVKRLEARDPQHIGVPDRDNRATATKIPSKLWRTCAAAMFSC